MRSVAAELGRGTMSLYRYVASRQDIERLLVDHVLDGVSLDLEPNRSWTEEILLISNRIRRAIAAHPAIVPLLMVHRHASVATRRISEALLQALSQAGFAGEQRVIALRALVSYILGALQTEHLGPLAGKGTQALAALPKSDYPLLSETAKAAKSVTVDQEFEGGLTLLLKGLLATRTEVSEL